MKFKIDINGMLSLWKRDKWVEQWCPYGPEDGRCGDWCPLFRVEERTSTRTIFDADGYRDDINLQAVTVHYLYLCRAQYDMGEEANNDSGDRSEDQEQGGV